MLGTFEIVSIILLAIWALMILLFPSMLYYYRRWTNTSAFSAFDSSGRPNRGGKR